MHNFNIYDIIVPFSIIALNETKNYFLRKSKRKKAGKFGDIEETINPYSYSLSHKLIAIIFGLIGVLFAISGIIGGIIKMDIELALSSIAYGMMFYFLPQRWNKDIALFICTNGIYTGDFECTWIELDRIEWDKDINQQKYGLKLYKKGQLTAHKIYIDRKMKNEFSCKLEELITQNTNILKKEI